MTSIADRIAERIARQLSRLGPEWMPFADAATPELPLGRLLRLSLFQVSVGMAMVLMTGTLNRVMIVELGVAASLVSIMVALPLLFAPIRVLVGYKSDTHRSFLGLRRVPYIVFGTMLQYGGLAIMPFALLILSGDTHGPVWIGHAGAALAFLLVGAGLHTTQTAGLALANDLAPEHVRPRVVALLYVSLLAGMMLSAIVLGAILTDFTPVRLIQVVQGTAVVTITLNFIALWKQEPRRPDLTAPDKPQPTFTAAWDAAFQRTNPGRLLIAVGLGAAAFSMQDVLLEPYGGEVLHLGVGSTTALTGLMAAGALAGFWFTARSLQNGFDPCRLAGLGALAGLVGLLEIILSSTFESANLFRAGTALLGFGSGLFAVGTLTAAMAQAEEGSSGLALGMWGAVNATGAGIAICLGGVLRDSISHLATSGRLGEAFNGPAAGYLFVYQIEIVLLFLVLIAIGPLVRSARALQPQHHAKLGLAEMPG